MSLGGSFLKASPRKDCASRAFRRIGSSIGGVHHGVWYDMKSTIQDRPTGTLFFFGNERAGWRSASLTAVTA